jgi:hypothetical protein
MPQAPSAGLLVTGPDRALVHRGDRAAVEDRAALTITISMSDMSARVEITSIGSARS